MMKNSDLKPPVVIPRPASEFIELATLLKGDDPDGLDDTYIDNDLTKELKRQGIWFVNDVYMDLLKLKSGILFVAGGYGSGKTAFLIDRQIVKSMFNPYHRLYYGRQYKEDARKLHKTIVDRLRANGWDKYFDFSDSPTGHTTFTCKLNGNQMFMFGCDDTESTKGMPDATDIFIDEINQVTFDSFGMLLTRLRKPGSPLEFSGTFNNWDVKPGHWLRKYVYSDEVPEQSDISRNERTALENLKKRKIVRRHTVYTDNVFLNHKRYYLDLVTQAGGDPARIAGIVTGDWGVDDAKMPYYNGFSTERNVGTVQYRPDLPLWLSLDENYNPYLPVGVFQVLGKNAWMLQEFIMETPKNTVEDACNAILSAFGPDGLKHTAGMFITGDRTAQKEDGKLEKGQNFFTLFEKHLMWFNGRAAGEYRRG